MSDILREAYAHLKAASPEVMKLVYPRRIVPPQGFPNPLGNGVALACHLSFNRPDHPLNPTMVKCLLIAWKLAELGSPVYFVGHDLATALAMTDAPDESFPMDQLKWPHDALTFVLPDKFSIAYFGRRVPFLRVARQPSRKMDPPECVTAVAPQWEAVGIQSKMAGDDAVLVGATVMYRSKRNAGEEFPVDFAFSCSSCEKIGDVIKSHEFIDDAKFGEQMHVIEPFVSYVEDETTEEQDLELTNRMVALGLQLVMAMTALPQHIQMGAMARPAKIKRGEIVRDELWNPNVFGGAYILHRPKAPAEGTHASPRLHRRRGHWRTKQRYGPNNSLVKCVWIEPTWIGADL